MSYAQGATTLGAHRNKRSPAVEQGSTIHGISSNTGRVPVAIAGSLKISGATEPNRMRMNPPPRRGKRAMKPGNVVVKNVTAAAASSS